MCDEAEPVDGSARHGNDFKRAGGTLVIPAGRTSGPIATHATIGDGEAEATILDDDTAPPGRP